MHFVDFLVAVAAAGAVAGGFGCRLPGCGWDFLVPVLWLWLGRSGAGAVLMARTGKLVYIRSFLVRMPCPSLGSCRACLHNVSHDCLHGMQRRMFACVCSHGCLHAALHGCQMMTPDKGCIDVTML